MCAAVSIPAHKDPSQNQTQMQGPKRGKLLTYAMACHPYKPAVARAPQRSALGLHGKGPARACVPGGWLPLARPEACEAQPPAAGCQVVTRHAPSGFVASSPLLPRIKQAHGSRAGHLCVHVTRP